MALRELKVCLLGVSAGRREGRVGAGLRGWLWWRGASCQSSEKPLVMAESSVRGWRGCVSMAESSRSLERLCRSPESLF